MRTSRLFMSKVACVLLASAAAHADVSEHKKSCSSADTATARKALNDAKAALVRAIGSFTGNAQPVTMQQKWFGPLNTQTAEGVRKVYESALGAATFTVFWCPIKNDLDFKWDVGDLAAVHRSEPGAIFLTPAFFKLKETGADSLRGTMVHELTHIVGTGLKKEVYGVPDAKDLAKKDPARARNNSDNYQYYVEDLLFGIR